MKLTPTILLTAVWAAAITGILVLSASIASAETMTLTYDITDDGNSVPSILTVEYDELAFADNLIYGETDWNAGENNWGWCSIDNAPVGYVDVQAQWFDVTLTAAGGFIQPVDDCAILTHNDILRFWRHGSGEGIEWYRAQPDVWLTMDSAVLGTPNFTAVPEPASYTAALIGLAALVCLAVGIPR